MPRQDALVNPGLLSWARKSANFRIDEAAKRAGIEESQLQDWENGVSKPTIRQAERLADTYGRPLAAFYLAEIPKDFQVLRDFRRVSGADAGGYSADLVLLIRELQGRQDWAIGALQDAEGQRLPFVGKFSLDHDPQRVAASIRAALALSVSDQLKAKSLNEALNMWVEAAEDAGVFVSQTSYHGRVAIEDARAFVLVDKFAPFVWLNAKDTLGARIFSLAHELAHLWIGRSGVSGTAAPKPSTEEGRIEVFCNAVAARVVLPTDLLEDLGKRRGDFESTAEWIEWGARFARISRDVVARSSLEHHWISKNEYAQLHKAYLLEASTKSESGGGNYYINHSRSVGRMFVRLVADRYSRQRITGPETSRLLNVKLNKLPGLLSAADRAGSRSA